MEEQGQTLTEPTLQELAERGREAIKPNEMLVRSMAINSIFSGDQEAWHGQHEELQTHIDLAIRNLEDARMRLGKVLQYLNEDTTSVFDK